MLHLTPSDYVLMPWKNGGGSTTEIAIEPPDARLGESFTWRVSSAAVATSGPFSSFPGLMRSLLLVEGVGFILDIEGQGRLRLKHPGQVVSFSGDSTVGATLIQGPCVDFGIISDPAKVRIELLWLNLSRLELEPKDCLRFDPADAGTKLGLRAAFGTTPLVVASILPLA